MRASRRLIDWARAVVEVSVPVPDRLRGTSLMPFCTRRDHHEGCSCSRGTVRYFHTNHHKTSLSRSFDAIRRALGATPWHEGGDIEVIA